MGLAAVLVGASAQAADIAPVYKAPPVAAPAYYNWTGFYLGGHVGGAFATSTVDGSAGTFDDTGPQSQTLKPQNWFGGGQIGFNWQVGNVVLGVEADLGRLNLVDGVQFAGPGSDRNDDIFKTDYGRYYTVTGRLGWAVDRVLVYGKGGYVNVKIAQEAGDMDGNTNDPTDYVAVSKNRGGWTLGGGLEWAFYANWSIKAEYLYMKLQDVSVTNLDQESYTFNDKIQTFKIGLNYKFDWSKAPVMAKY